MISDRDINFLDPYIGVRLTNNWTKWSISSRAYRVGFDIGSEYSYKFNGLVTYKFSNSFATSVGCSLYKTKYKINSFQYNLAHEGFLLGFTFIL